MSGPLVELRGVHKAFGALKVLAGIDLAFERGKTTVILGLVLTLAGRAPEPATSLAGWTLVLGLGLGSVFAANLFFFAAVKQIEAAPTAVAASTAPSTLMRRPPGAH